MGTFTVPNTIQSGDASDATKAMANWSQVVNDLNSSHLIDATNCNQTFAKDNVEPIFPMWKPILFGFVLTSAATTTPNLLTYPYYFDPAQYTAGGRTTKIRVRSILGCNTVFGGGYTITASFSALNISRGAPTAANVYTLGATAASAAAAPATGLFHAEGAAVAAPAAGFYALSIATSANDSSALFDAQVIVEVQQA